MKTPQRVWIMWRPEKERYLGVTEIAIAWSKAEAAVQRCRDDRQPGDFQVEYQVVPEKKP